MKINKISHPELKDHINMTYLYSENKNQEMIDKTDNLIKNYLASNIFIISTENSKAVKIPYGNHGEYVIPIFTDQKEYERGQEYFRLNDMDENKDYKIGKLKRIDDPKFLGYLINIASASYITLF